MNFRNVYIFHDYRSVLKPAARNLASIDRVVDAIKYGTVLHGQDFAVFLTGFYLYLPVILEIEENKDPRMKHVAVEALNARKPREPRIPFGSR